MERLRDALRNAKLTKTGKKIAEYVLDHDTEGLFYDFYRACLPAEGQRNLCHPLYKSAWFFRVYGFPKEYAGTVYGKSKPGFQFYYSTP